MTRGVKDSFSPAMASNLHHNPRRGVQGFWDKDFITISGEESKGFWYEDSLLLRA